MPPMKRILVADDHSLVRFGLKVALQNNFSGCVIDESADGNSVLSQLKVNHYDLVLLDLGMPDTDPAILLHWIRNFHPETKVLIVSMNNENMFGKRSLQMGAHGYIEKDATPDELIKAVYVVLSGKKYMSSNLSEIIINDTLNGKSNNPFNELSPREFQVAMYIIQDYSVTQISEMMQLQYTSVSTFRRRIFEKLDVADRKALVQLAGAYSLN
jgi:DNA-binding NarL/FixJ family response regulator